MWRPPIPHSAAIAVGLAAIVLTGCSAQQGPRPTRSADPSASPIIETDAPFCGALDVLQSEHMILREIRLRPANRGALDDQFDQLDIAWQDVRDAAPRGMAEQLDALDWAVIDLGLAVEDYTTTDRFEQAADHVLRRDITFARAIARLRARTTCAPWAPTPIPERTPTPAPSTPASPVGPGSALPSTSASPAP